MRRTGRVTVTAIACGLLTAFASPALAYEQVSTYEGGCSFDTVSHDAVTGTDRWVGALDAAIVLYSRAHGNVVTADVDCVLLVNGVEQVRASGSGTGVVAFADTLTFTATDVDSVTMCTVVDFTSDPTPTSWDCGVATTQPWFPPQEVIDLLDFVFAVANQQLSEHVDPAVCDAFTRLGPGTPGVVEVGAGGDVYLLGEIFWDCPPYEWGPPPEPGEPTYTIEGPTGGGYHGDAGFLTLLSPETTEVTLLPAATVTVSAVSSTCLFVVDRARGVVTVDGGTTAAGATPADGVRIGCTLLDVATGEVVYEGEEAAAGNTVRLHDTFAAPAAGLTVCTSGGGTWGAREVTVGPHCRSDRVT